MIGIVQPDSLLLNRWRENAGGGRHGQYWTRGPFKSDFRHDNGRVNTSGDLPPHFDQVYSSEQLQQALSKADFVVL